MFTRSISYILSKMYLLSRLGNILCDNTTRYSLTHQVEKKIDCRFKDQTLGRETNPTLWPSELPFAGPYWIRYNTESFATIVKKKNSIKHNNDTVRILCTVHVSSKGMRHQPPHAAVAKRVGDSCADLSPSTPLIK